jgi:tripartite-type tricarboxylate transporter receptor subunit TctC
VQAGPRKEDELPDVPLLADLVANDDDQRVVGVITLPLALGYSYWLPPGVPPDRVAALRDAFAATAADPALREEAAARHIIIRPQEGAALEALVRETAATPKPVIDKAVRLLGWK